MNTDHIEQEARDAMAQQRQHEEHLHKSMLSRSQAEVDTPPGSHTAEEARESMIEQRQQEEQLQQSMRSRSAAEVGLSKDKSSQT
ncbi:hypothetical protein [Gloeocapsopsis dulcis]|uniref:Uncharacterized protein n=1 Tax=Gloeocapsopsis dulcis AAB1 = 1H9 TaxID=1433147 RepID=A0A6N8FP41_9CHRO|nr:hypothetical protein [Gloeocapsopsis dulcis]MUL34889.1 hypothetical protein [Gloeocapsopsis dulcis AAB1 = 1H9]WNN90041.1 hypothetical protein P0S91_02775 [Gloeocapsopsis dulcis]